MKKLKPEVLRKTIPTKTEIKKIQRTPMIFVLDEIIDTYNIGSLFRLADAVAGQKMYLCGTMEYPPSSRIHKAAVGTENWVPWEKKDCIFETVRKLKEEGYFIVAIEQDKNSVEIKKLKKDMVKFPMAIVAGNETLGLSKKLIKMSDIIIELPMLGINNSFNVWGATAVVAYKMLEFIPLRRKLRA